MGCACLLACLFKAFVLLDIQPSGAACRPLSWHTGLKPSRRPVPARCGAFKARGAMNAVFSLSESEAARGVVTHSSGNHGAALAFAARQRGIPAAVVVPANTPEIKRAAIRGYGVEPVVCPPTIDAREAACREIRERTGAAFVPPYNHPAVIAGQGTIALELLEQAGSGREMPAVRRRAAWMLPAAAYGWWTATRGIWCLRMPLPSMHPAGSEQ